MYKNLLRGVSVSTEDLCNNVHGVRNHIKYSKNISADNKAVRSPFFAKAGDLFAIA